jgi:hypothetical protein
MSPAVRAEIRQEGAGLPPVEVTGLPSKIKGKRAQSPSKFSVKG